MQINTKKVFAFEYYVKIYPYYNIFFHFLSCLRNFDPSTFRSTKSGSYHRLFAFDFDFPWLI